MQTTTTPTTYEIGQKIKGENCHLVVSSIKLTVKMISYCLESNPYSNGRVYFFCDPLQLAVIDEAERKGYIFRQSYSQAQWTEKGLEKAKKELSFIEPTQPETKKPTSVNTYAKFCPNVFVAKSDLHEQKAAYWADKADTINLSMPESLEYFEFKLEQAKAKHESLKNGSIPRSHSFSLTYAKKDVNELEDKVKTAKRLWA